MRPEARCTRTRRQHLPWQLVLHTRSQQCYSTAVHCSHEKLPFSRPQPILKCHVLEQHNRRCWYLAQALRACTKLMILFQASHTLQATSANLAHAHLRHTTPQAPPKQDHTTATPWACSDAARQAGSSCHAKPRDDPPPRPIRGVCVSTPRILSCRSFITAGSLNKAAAQRSR